MADAATKLIAEAFAVAPAEVPEDAAVGQAPGWDSLGHMRLMLAIEARLNRRLTPGEIGRMTSLSAVRSLLGH